MKCRHCTHLLHHVFLDLGFAPPSNAYLTSEELLVPERYFPLKLFVCERCWLVQTEDYSRAEELFRADYAYFSSTSSSWLDHAATYAQGIIRRLQLTSQSFVIEIASNDGYLLKNFLAAGIPCLGIEPTDGTADVAERAGIPVVRKFFGERLGRQLVHEGRKADLIIGNNVYAHVPDINDFTLGLKAALKAGGTITLEFPHLMRMIEHTQFDTAYHEHFSYLSLNAASALFTKAGLRIVDVEELPTHGGSLRVYGCHAEDPRPLAASVAAVLDEERRRGLFDIATYLAFQQRANRVKNDFLAFLIEQNRAGKTVAAYGAAAKGNTLMNYAGVKADLLPYVCDAAPAKQGKFMPGSHIPILPPAALLERPPDYLVILPWNIAAEVRLQNAGLARARTRFVTAIPKLEVG